MTRRDLLVSILQALLLSLFPWLRSDRGALVAKQAAESMLPGNLDVTDYGYWVNQVQWHMVRGYKMEWTHRVRTVCGPTEQS